MCLLDLQLESFTALITKPTIFEVAAALARVICHQQSLSSGSSVMTLFPSL